MISFIRQEVEDAKFDEWMRRAKALEQRFPLLQMIRYNEDEIEE
jgi:NAD-dependent DNA ligase